ncbi:hypothetical protein JCM16358_22330 [Halanaerocella petrolearia]
MIEVLIVLGIIGIVGAAIVGILLTGWKIEKLTQQTVSVQRETRIILLRLTRDLHRTLEINHSLKDNWTAKAVSLAVDLNGNGKLDKGIDQYRRYAYSSQKKRIDYWQITINDSNKDKLSNLNWGSSTRQFAQDQIEKVNFTYNVLQKGIEIDLTLRQSFKRDRIKDKVLLRALQASL